MRELRVRRELQETIDRQLTCLAILLGALLVAIMAWPLIVLSPLM